MKHEIRLGIPNRIGAVSVFVQRVRSDYVRLIVDGQSAENYQVGSSINIGGDLWVVGEINEFIPQSDVPGATNGHIAAVLTKAD